MYKIFGSKENFNEDIKEVSPITFSFKSELKNQVFGEGNNSIKIVCISDIHSSTKNLEIPKCDLLVIAGDLINNRDGEKELKSISKWLDTLECKNIIIVGGNHDVYLEKNKSKISKIFPSAVYLEYNSFQLKDSNINCYGAPCTLRRNLFYLGNAYSIKGDQLKKEWEKIPDNTDILITHVPPYDILDLTYKNQHIGSKWLRNEICNRIQPKIHIFGHNHDSQDSFALGEFKNGKKCLFVNACVFYNRKPCIIEYKY